MKVVIVNVNSHTTSTGKIAYGLYKFLKEKGDEVRLVCRGALEQKIQDVDIISLDNKIEVYYSLFMSKLTGYEGVHNYFATVKLLRIIQIFKPDIVHLLNLPGHYVDIFTLLEFLKKNHIKTVYSMMDDYPFAGKCTFVKDCDKFISGCGDCPNLHDYPSSYFFDFSGKIFQRKKRIYNGFSELIFTGVKWSCLMARKSALTKNSKIIHIDHPINYEDIFYPRDSHSLKEKLNIPKSNKVILTAVSAKSERKGGIYFVELARKMLDRKDITFVFVGYNRSDWDIPSNMITVGYVSSQDKLAEYYSMADLYVCTSLADTFPTTCLNALGCGTPLLGFKAGGVPYCASEPYGTFVEVKDVDALVSYCQDITTKNELFSGKIRAYALERYSEPVIFGKFYNIYKESFDDL